MNDRRPSTASANAKIQPARPANRQERAGLGADPISVSVSNATFATTRPARPVSHSRSERPARSAQPARQRMDTPMTALEGPTTNTAASAAHPASLGKQDAQRAPGPGDRRAGSGGGSSVAFVDAGPAVNAAGRRPRAARVEEARRSPVNSATRAVNQESDTPIDNGRTAPSGMTSTNVTSSPSTPTIDIAPSTLAALPVGIVAAALKPDADPCDIACDAMPAHVVGDLTPPENAWLISHTDDCRYCGTMLDRYHHVDSLLDTMQRALEPMSAPPPFRPPAPRAVPDRRVAPKTALRRASYGALESPVGPLRIAVTEAGVCEIGFAVNENETEFRRRLAERGFAPEPCPHGDLGPAAIARVTRQLEEYFSGRRDEFDVPLDFAGISPFTQSVLAATAAIPFGHLATYRDIAERIGAPRATRAVGNALGRNPIPVIVPCHRIVRSDATIGGYTGGLRIKKRLLAIEGIAAPS